MDGGSLQDIVDTGGCRGEAVLANIAHRVLLGLSFLHRERQVHRDLKPANLLINQRGDVKISDFGVSRTLDDVAGDGPALACCDTFVGTVTYMSPERLAGDRQAQDAPADVWGLGVTLFTCALGRSRTTTAAASGAAQRDARLRAARAARRALGRRRRGRGPPAAPPAEGAGLPRGKSVRFSRELASFCRECMAHDPAERPSAEQLLSHPFVAPCVAAAEAEGACGAAASARPRRSPRRGPPSFDHGDDSL